MAQTSFIDLDPEEEDLFFKSLTSQDRFKYPRITRKLVLFSVKRKKGLSQRSFLPAIAELWNAFSAAEKEAWSDAAVIQKELHDIFDFVAENAFYGLSPFGIANYGKYFILSNLNGWRLFVQDQSIRIKNDIAGVATPSLLHQAWVGYLNVEAPATKIKIAQYHPRSYWVSKKVYGKKGMYVPIEITEDLGLPLKIQLNYKSNLTSTGAGSYAKFYAEVRSSYQGVDRFTDLEIPLDLIADWKEADTTLTTVPGYVIGYTLYFHLYNLQGSLYFDNVKVEHSSQNWCRDPLCKNINEGFTKAFFQIPKHWVAVELPDGATYESFYPT
jgi:hypothetical protein